MRFHVISLFPHLVESYASDSILARAQENKHISIDYWNPRDFTKDKHHRVDQRPYGGGPGMVLEAEPFLRAAEKAVKLKGKKAQTQKIKYLFFAPGGKQFTNTYARKLATSYTDVVLLCGRYEGIDARLKKVLRAEPLSIGDYVLTGGEVPAMIIIDSVSRQIPGVLGKFASLEEERVTSGEVYTRPEVLEWKKKKYRVPKVLITGHHAKIEEWKKGRKF